MKRTRLKNKVLSFDGVDDYVNGAEKEKGFNYSLKIMFFPRPLAHEEIVMLHEGRIKPVRCRKCNYYFTNRSELMRHVWIRHRT